MRIGTWLFFVAEVGSGDTSFVSRDGYRTENGGGRWVCRNCASLVDGLLFNVATLGSFSLNIYARGGLSSRRLSSLLAVAVTVVKGRAHDVVRLLF